MTKVDIRGISEPIKCMDMVNICGSMVLTTKANGDLILCMELANFGGQMDIHMWENMFADSGMEEGNCIGRMENEFMMDTG